MLAGGRIEKKIQRFSMKEEDPFASLIFRTFVIKFEEWEKGFLLDMIIIIIIIITIKVYQNYIAYLITA